MNEHHHDNEFIKNANNLVNRLQAERNLLLEENRRSREIIHEAIIPNVERLNALYQQMNTDYQRLGETESQIELLQMPRRF
jgi:archaellum component FlaC